MDQPHFIAMWKSFYDIFIEHKREQEAYHSIVKVGTLLISLGDVGKFHQNNPLKPDEKDAFVDPLTHTVIRSRNSASSNSKSKTVQASQKTTPSRPTSLPLADSKSPTKGDSASLKQVQIS
jgi:hypothetical protein